MADSKISALTDGGNLQSGDQIAIARGGVSYRAVPMVDGWLDDTAETWTYASGSGGGTATFTVTGDVTAKYTPGTRIKLTQTTTKYFVVVSSSVATGTTTVTITAGSDYTLANAAISANYHSYAANPQGYPGWFNFSASPSGWSGTPTVTARFSVIGRRCTINLNISGTSNATSATATVPIALGASAMGPSGPFVATNSGANGATPGRALLSGSTITCVRDWSGTAWTNSGTKGIGNLALDYEI